MTTAEEIEEEVRETTTTTGGDGDADLDDDHDIGDDNNNDIDDDDDDDDPYIELEQIDGKVATDFVHFSNQMCLLGLGDPTKKKKKNDDEDDDEEEASSVTTSRYERILKSFENQRHNRIPLVSQFGTNPQTGEIELYNLWKKDHQRSENVSFLFLSCL